MRAGCHPVAIAQVVALTAKVRGPQFNPGWLPVFHSSLKIFPSLSSCTGTSPLQCVHVQIHVLPIPSVMCGFQHFSG